MLLLLVEIRRRAERVDAARKAKKRYEWVEEMRPPTIVSCLNNLPLLKQLSENEALLEFEAAQKWNWNSEDTFLQKDL